MSKVCSVKELTSFISQLSDSLSTHPSTETLAALQGALEELHIAEETLHEQAAELQKALKRADAERYRYLELFEFAPDAYCVTDRRGVILELNRAGCDLLQDDAAAVLGKPIFVFIDSDQKGELRNFLSRVGENGSADASATLAGPVLQTEFTIVRRNQVCVSARCCLSSDRLHASRILWMWRDVTEQKRMQDNLTQMTKQLERTVEDKTDELHQRLEELETFHDVAVSRELRLIDLEKKLKKFESENLPPSASQST